MTEKVSYDDYQKIQAQSAELEAKAKSVREALLADEIKAIKAKIKELGLKPSQLFSPSKLAGDSQDAPVSMGEKIAKATKAKEPIEVKYRGPNGETWGGGRGRKPAWVQAILDAGGDIEKFKV